MDALRYIYWVVGLCGLVLIVVPSFLLMAHEAPHLLLLMVALAVPLSFGLRAVERALKPRYPSAGRSRRVPRASGDEPPSGHWTDVWRECSPRERG